MCRAETFLKLGAVAKGDCECGIGAEVTHVCSYLDIDLIKLSLYCDIVTARCVHGFDAGCEAVTEVLRDRCFHRHLAACLDVGETHAKCRQDSRIGMDHDRAHAQRGCDPAGQLRSGASEALKGVEACVGALGDRNLLDGLGHVGHCDVQKTICGFLG